MWDPHPQRKCRTARNLTIVKSTCWSVLVLIATHALLVGAEIKFIPRDNILEESASIPHANKVDRSHEPLALESAVVATVHLSPSSSNSSTGRTEDEDKPSINSSPVLHFHAPKEEEDELDYDDEDEDEVENDTKEESAISAAVGQILRSDSLLGEKVSEDDTDPDADIQNLAPTTRHRRRLMLLRSRNILVPETSTSSSVSTSSTTSSSSRSTSSLRPPKEHIIYALPEQSFWAKRPKGGKKGQNNSKVPATPHLDEDATPTTEIPLPLSGSGSDNGEDLTQEEDVTLRSNFNQQTQNDVINITPPSTTTSNFYHLAQNQNQAQNYPSPGSDSKPQFAPFAPFAQSLNGDSNINFQQFLTTPPPPPTTVSTTPPTTTTPSSTSTTPTPTPSPAETLRMTLAEKKFHLGQCMRYCMDAIL